MFIVVRVCVCVGVRVLLSFTKSFFVSVSVCHGEFCGFKFAGSSFSFFGICMYVCFFFRPRTRLA